MPTVIAITLGAIFAALPALFWLVLWYLKDKKEPEPKRMIVFAFLFGALAAIPLVGLSVGLARAQDLRDVSLYFKTAFPLIFFLSIPFLAALLEEWLKHFAVLRLGKRLRVEFNQLVDGIIYSIAAALGFAFAENILYFWSLLGYYELADIGLWKLMAFRGGITTLSHALFSGVFGFFWAHAFLSRDISPHHNFSVSHFFGGLRRTIRFHVLFHHVLQRRPSAHGHEKAELLREGLLLATLLHTVFNLLFDVELYGIRLTFLIVPLLLCIFIFLAYQFNFSKNTVIVPAPISKNSSMERKGKR